jgi:broad specificity phosphatase PhoE
MPAPISIYLIRHGESEANLNKSINTIKADHLVELSLRGQEQAVEAGTKLGTILTEPIKEGGSSLLTSARIIGRGRPGTM